LEWKVQLFELNFDEEEIQTVADVARSGWLTMGERTKEFEQQFACFLGADTQAVAVSSGTAALHMALLALGIGPGDEVIIPSLTFIADINVVRMVGAKPVLADCTSMVDWNIDVEEIKRKITQKTKALIAVHYGGNPCAMDEIVRICEQHHIALIEDAAHAVGAMYAGRQCGTFGDIGCFSFFTNKNLSVGEGGMFVSGSPELVTRAKHLRSHGMSTLTLDRHQGRAISYDVITPGLNYRIDEFRAALGTIQLKKLATANLQRREIVGWYNELLRPLEMLSIPFLNHQLSEPSFHIYPVLLAPGIDRFSVITKLRERGIQSSIHYPPIQSFTAYSMSGLEPTPIANDISSRELTLPLYPTMTKADVELVVSSLIESLS
jgi:dTDP-4-amino-4,6-dideoxygalactose transaminase